MIESSSMECDDLTNELKYLGNKSNIKLFKKCNQDWILRDYKKIIEDCNKMKRKKIIDLSNYLKNISYGNIELNIIKNKQDKIYSDIIDIDNIINIISNNINLLDSNEKYIEVYEN